MKKNKFFKIFIYIVISITILLLALLTHCMLNFPDFGPFYSKVELNSKQYNESIFIKKREYGAVTSANIFYVISKSPKEEFKPDQYNEYVFETLYPFFYTFKNDTLRVFSNSSSSIPDKFETNIVIIQKKLSIEELYKLSNKFDVGLKKVE